MFNTLRDNIEDDLDGVHKSFFEDDEEGATGSNRKDGTGQTDLEIQGLENK